MLHNHESFESLTSLAEHVGKRHAASPPIEEELHWHFVSPRELNQSEGSENNSDSSEVSVVCLTTSGSTTAYGEKLAANPLGRTLFHTCELAEGISSPAYRVKELDQLFSSLRPSVRLCALLCVVRC
ncbi:hypothetical protein Pr1d_05560 [Bythopirellula goksoeyrii]|uniref:Uncharacterized protein n=1 Tax=Bythopirellula goksoeyrii TaxID=1400387 RepID=A0A5B9Q6Y8_9BACT|nr:hypothetical protein Pr1d_05560 [Bythopirellula goksoeyrii]